MAQISDAIVSGVNAVCCAVVFAEIIGFQELTKKLPPMKGVYKYIECPILGIQATPSNLTIIPPSTFAVTNLLDRVFYELDRLAKEFDIFKVETVGQCYMVSMLATDQDGCTCGHMQAGI